jgi:hypothetical protein
LIWERGLEQVSPTRRRYAALRRWLALGAADPPDSATPNEVADALHGLAPEAAQSLDVLIRRYVAVTYGGAADDAESAGDEAAWQALRRPVARAMLRRRIRLLMQRFRQRPSATNASTPPSRGSP